MARVRAADGSEMVGIGVAALAVVMAAMNWQLLAGRWDEQTIIIAVFSLPGLFLLGAWLIRLVQWRAAARAASETVPVTPCLADGAVPRGGRLGPVTQSLWMVIGEGKNRRYQRVSWKPWLSELQGPVQAEVRAGSRPEVAVIDVPGHGRLWPTSWLLTQPPRTVQLTEFTHATSVRTRGDAIYRISYVLVLFLIPCIGIGSLWGIAYLAAFAFAVWLWFGMAPPGWAAQTLTKSEPDKGSATKERS